MLQRCDCSEQWLCSSSNRAASCRQVNLTKADDKQKLRFLEIAPELTGRHRVGRRNIASPDSTDSRANKPNAGVVLFDASNKKCHKSASRRRCVVAVSVGA